MHCSKAVTAGLGKRWKEYRLRINLIRDGIKFMLMLLLSISFH